MVKKFLQGLVFGFGFSISLVVVAYLSTSYLFPVFFYPNPQTTGYISALPDFSEDDETPFHELSIDEQIDEASVIALTKHESSGDGKTKSVIAEILKKDPDTEFYYNVGDEYPPASFYPEENVRYGDGQVIFFVGSPAMMKVTMSFSRERISGLGDMPLELFREKCNDEDA